MRIALVVVFVPALAWAEPSVAPNLYGTGNLRVEMACANFEATPRNGLGVTVDGEPRRALRINGNFDTIYDSDGNPSQVWGATDIGYLVNPGAHHITVSAPGCTPRSADVMLAADHAEVITGRLAISDPSLLGPAGAPNGLELTLGMIAMPTPRGPGSAAPFSTTYQFDPGYTSYGAWVSIGAVTKSWIYAFDFDFAIGATSGTINSTDAFTGSAYRWSQEIRIGKRLALHDVAFAGGLGLGYDVWFDSMDGTTMGPNAPDGSWFVPAWAGATVKPACNWGVQVLAEYDLHPTASQDNGTTLGIGWIYEPSDACSQPPSMQIAPNA